MKYLLAAAVAFFAFAAESPAIRAEDTKLTVIVFPGVQNLPMFAAQAKGFYAKRGLNVDLKFTPNSDELAQRSGRGPLSDCAFGNRQCLRAQGQGQCRHRSRARRATTASIISWCSPTLSLWPTSKARPSSSMRLTPRTLSSFMRCCGRRVSTKATMRSNQPAGRTRGWKR